MQLCFRLLEDPGLGTFSFSSGNWAFAEQATNTLASLDGACLTFARLSLQWAPHWLPSGTTITYTRPALVLVRAGFFEVAATIRP